MTEIWKDISGFNGKYKVSNKGEIYSVKRGILLKPCLTNDGYEFIRLSRGSKIKPRIARVHRLVMEAFIPNDQNKPQVNHIDSNKRNNCVSNLEWVTQCENMQHLISVNKFPRRDGKNNARAKLVLNLETGIVYDTAKEAAEAHCINPYTLRGYLNGIDTNYSSMIYL